jgi:ATP-dependent DNA helicase RecG
MYNPAIAESTLCDFKRELERTKPISWLKSVSAFANGIGGTIVFGIDDKSHQPVGLVDIQNDADFISETIKTKITPVPSFTLQPDMTENKKQVLVLQVQSGMQTPYYYSGENTKTAYIRIGNESVNAPATALNELVLKGQHLTWDTLKSPFVKNDYSFTLLEATFFQETKSHLLPKEYVSFSLADADGTLTYGGALFADQCPVKNSRLFCTRWNGITKTSIFDDAVDDKEFDNGNLIQLLNGGIEFVKANTKVRWRKTETSRIDMPDYPERALYESLVNALIHRDYGMLGSEVHIDIYDDRLTITSPGGMYDGTLIQNLDPDAVASVRRNPVIADMFFRLQYMERRGSGLHKIREAYEDAEGYEQKFAPLFSSSSSGFMVTLWNLNYESINVKGGGLTEAKVASSITAQRLPRDCPEIAQKTYTAIVQNPKATIAELHNQLGIAERTVKNHLALLKKEGFIKRSGSDTNGYWEILQ